MADEVASVVVTTSSSDETISIPTPMEVDEKREEPAPAQPPSIDESPENGDNPMEEVTSLGDIKEPDTNQAPMIVDETSEVQSTTITTETGESVAVATSGDEDKQQAEAEEKGAPPADVGDDGVGPDDQQHGEVIPDDPHIDEEVILEDPQHDHEIVEDPQQPDSSNQTVEETVVDSSTTSDPPSDNKTTDEVVQIVEVQADEGDEPEATDDGQYTVVEVAEGETHESIEEHIAQTEEGTTVLLVHHEDDTVTTEEVSLAANDSMSEEEIFIVGPKDSDETRSLDDEVDMAVHEEEDYEVALQQEQAVECVKKKPGRPRGRKPIADVPLHVLGRNIARPKGEVSNGGRVMPKPRLGVKVPYRNLTSQIVTKEEIEREIMDRNKQKQEANAANQANAMFARKLTQRLAKKITPQEEKTKAGSSSEKKMDENADLLAILEGDGDDPPVEESSAKTTGETAPPPAEAPPKMTEREIALQQLSELPMDNVGGTKRKFFKTSREQSDSPHKDKITQTPKAAKRSIAASGTIDDSDPQPSRPSNVHIKTYTRKRRSSDSVSPPPPCVVIKKDPSAPTPRKTDNPDVYVTKSSRVIKKKVIWDPDEIPNIKSPPTPAAPSKIVTKIVHVHQSKTSNSNPASSSTSSNLDKKPLTTVSAAAKKKTTPPSPAKKRLTEVDKLLMDEGAINMIYDVKTNDEDSQKPPPKKKSVISLDRAQKELITRAKSIKDDLQQTTEATSHNLRKKEVVTPTNAPSTPKKDDAPPKVGRKKSNSVRSSVHSPPPSPFPEASRIIRRHSSSSFSSNDGGEEDAAAEGAGGGGGGRTTRRKSSVSNQGGGDKKKFKKNDSKVAAKNLNNNAEEGKKKGGGVNHVNAEPGETIDDFDTISVTKSGSLVNIKLEYGESDDKCYLSEETLIELTAFLKTLSKSDDCHVVSITSASTKAFCHGLDYKVLVLEDETTRKRKAVELSNLVKDFLRSLLHFPKVLIAGIQGDCVGLAVTMLPLFDIVVASDTSVFSTPYARLGTVAEGGSLLTGPFAHTHLGLASELLFSCLPLKADEASRKGLVTRLCWPEKYKDDFQNILTMIATKSRQSVEATKKQIRQESVKKTEDSLNSMAKVLVEHWTSAECQKKFTNYRLEEEGKKN